MKTFDDIESTLRSQREGFISYIIRSDASRDNQLVQARSLITSLLTTILTVSLTIGIAMVPLVLIAPDIPQEQGFFVKIGGMLLLVNSVILVVRLKRIVELLAFRASEVGLYEKRIAIKMRNYFTKSLLTKDVKYFEDYNRESRLIADEAIDGMIHASTNSQDIDPTTDVTLSLMVLGIAVIIRPAAMFIPLWMYLLLLGLLILGLIYFIYKEYAFGKKYDDKIRKQYRLISDEEKDMNDFVREVINGGSNGNDTSARSTRKKS